ncbi:hypothetical protein V6N11_017340 [Hibiscus sabdariffa]|uniref:RNase H type-1 domain-containing protein n=1 Tax=Hibiscus sabdariffa TaxID=183260 RepID=A0ABR2TYI1_9ROSI
MRNEIVFEHKKVDVSQLFFVAKSRLAFWFKAKYPDSSISYEDIFTDPSLADRLKFLDKRRANFVSWSPPPSGALKLNVDGAVARHGKTSGVGGLLRNCEGKVLMSFSGQVGEDRLIVESDSSCAVEWVSFPNRCTGIYSALVKEISTLARSGSVLFQHTPRVCNIDADCLAKRGIG